MDNKICTKNGCIPFKEYVMPLSGDSVDRCKLASAIINYIWTATQNVDDETGNMPFYNSDGQSECQEVIKKAEKELYALIGCEEVTD